VTIGGIRANRAPDTEETAVLSVSPESARGGEEIAP
jgi:hypothetical protein